MPGNHPELEPTQISLIRWVAEHTIEHQLLGAPLGNEKERSDTPIHSAAWMGLQGAIMSEESQSPSTGFLYSTLETGAPQKRRMGEGSSGVEGEGVWL